MKALVLCGGLPQIELIKNLKSRGITTVLADYNEKCIARPFADIFYPVSTLDVQGVKELAINEKVDFVITVCADQVLLVMAEVSDALGLPCYIDFETAKNVSNKNFMKQIFVKNDVPTTKFVCLKEFDEDAISHLKYPIIVKPVDSYSSRGVKKVKNIDELKDAFDKAVNISRTKTAIVEEFFEGSELTVDVYVEDGKANLLSVSELYKIPGNNKFVIHRLVHPAPVSEDVINKVKDTAQKIADGFNLKNTTMLIQLITDGKEISVVEFCARTGGGVKFQFIKKVSGFDVVDAIVKLTLGEKPHVGELKKFDKMIVNEFLYCSEGVFSKIEGMDELLADGVISDYSVFKSAGTKFADEINASGDRIAYFSIEANDLDDARRRHKIANGKIKAISEDGKDIIRHDLLDNL